LAIPSGVSFPKEPHQIDRYDILNPVNNKIGEARFRHQVISSVAFGKWGVQPEPGITGKPKPTPTLLCSEETRYDRFMNRFILNREWVFVRPDGIRKTMDAHDQRILFFFSVLPERKKFTVYLFSLVEVGMEVDLGRPYRSMPEVFLDDPEIFRAPVEFACIAVPDLMGRDPGRRIFFEDMLDGPGRDVFPLLPEKQRP
jgi:hypothetical protein